MGYLTTKIPSFFLLVVSVYSYPHYDNFKQGDFNIDSQLYKTNDEVNPIAYKKMNVNPDEMGSDILVSERRRTRMGSQDTYDPRWSEGLIPYMIDPIFSEDQRLLIEGYAMGEFRKHTCIKFVDASRNKDKYTDYIYITSNNKGCSSYVGRVGGRQDVELQIPGCVTGKGTAVHELLHAIGFNHEQSRPDRDQYVQIQYHNIQEGHEHNFDIAQSNTLGLPYDYYSVMHYSAGAFSNNGQPTIVTKPNKNIEIGQRNGLSKGDIKKIRKLYNCRDRSAWTMFPPGKDPQAAR